MSPLEKLNGLLAEGWQRNPFYAAKWRAARAPTPPLSTMAELAQFPLTTRAELVADQAAHPPFGTLLSRPIDAYTQFHRSSGTVRHPLWWADTETSWEAVLGGSQELFRLADVTADDRIYFVTPFARLSGPWILCEGASRLGCTCIRGSTDQPLEQWHILLQSKPTVLVGKPARLQALARAAPPNVHENGRLGVRKLILTGENAPPLFRRELEDRWSAPCFDRYGMTETGSVASECAAHSGALHVLENALVTESIDPLSGEPVKNGALGELVLTTLDRGDHPVVRYRTGDRVRLVRNYHCSCGRKGTVLLGGVQRYAHTDAASPRRRGEFAKSIRTTNP